MNRLLALLTGLLGIALAASGAIQLLDVAAYDRSSRNYVFTGVQQLRVDGSAGDVELVPGSPGDEIRVETRITRGLASPKVTTSRDGDSLRLRGTCPAFISNQCRVRWRIFVPRGLRIRADVGGGDLLADGIEPGGTLRLRSSGGSVTLRDVRAPSIDLSSSAGDVTAERVRGETITMQSSAGEVRADALTGTLVTATSSAGGVDVGLAAPARELTATSSAGDVRVLLPGGGVTYDVEAGTTAGDTRVEVPVDAESPRRVNARSSAGDVTVRAAR